MDRYEYRRLFDRALKHDDPAFFGDDPAALMRLRILGNTRAAALDFYNAEFKRLCSELKANGYTRVTLGEPPGWIGGPKDSISAWPAHSKREPKRTRDNTDEYNKWRNENTMLWNVLGRYPLFSHGCGNGGRDSWGDQAQINCTIPAEFLGTYEL